MKATWHTRKELGIPYENCPYCGSKVTIGENGEYRCDFCDSDYNDYEMEHEELRHALSAFICNRDEDSAIDCHVSTNPSYMVDMGGTRIIDKVFETYDGVQWAHFYGTPKNDWADIDEFSNDAIKDILNFFIK